MHGADVDIGVAGYLARRADKTGPVLMVAEEEVAAGGHDIHPEVIDPDDMRFAVYHRAGASGGASAGGDLNGDEAGVVFAGRFFLFDDGQAAAGSHDVGIDNVDPLFTYPFQKPAQDGGLEGVGVIIRDLALVFNLYGIRLSLGELADQMAQRRCHLDKGRQRRERLRGYKGGVDGVAGWFPL